jgi:hypothetical protein
MPSDYTAIRADNQQRYGTDIARIGPMLLADRYDDRTHFIYELLQNAEDALARRAGWSGARAVQFHLGPDMLRLSHYGKPFDDRDVRGICGIAESTHDRTAIGRFGIGFKSVYAYTARPEVHSGHEDFAIESFVWPTASPQMARDLDETVIALPLNAGPITARAEIAKGLQRLGPGTLLFLREIEEIEWEVGEGPSGVYLRSKPKILGSGIRRITVLGQEAGKEEVEESWLIFFRDVRTDEGVMAGQVEIAFSISDGEDSAGSSIQPVANSPLVVFFPTVVPTNLGFLIQGPYRTTPSRDNVPRNDPWNQGLIKETASLLIDALEWLRDTGHLDVSALRCLPLDRSKFHEESMFTPLFETVRTQLKSCRLLPSSTGSYVPASAARLARTQELRQLFSPHQLGALFGSADELAWLSGDISPDRTPELRQYMMRELDITEVTPEMALARLDRAFLEAQPDEWILKLYEFLQGQPALVRGGRIDNVPIIRLTNGTHVTVRKNGQPGAFLPSAIETAFPTVRKSVCNSVEARKFLEALGLTEPDPVDDVVWNVLPKYRNQDVDVPADAYPADIRRFLEAFGTDSKTQREKLIAALRDTPFVMAVDAGDRSKCVSKPGELYLATARLTELFAGVKGAFLVDDEYDCLRGEDVRDFLEACGASRCLQPISVYPEFTWEQRRALRIAGGCESSSGSEWFTDYSLRGLDQLLAALGELDYHAQVNKASLLWEALGELEDRRGAGVFTGRYQWTYYHTRSAAFDSSFVRRLNTTTWIPDAKGNLQNPRDLVFSILGWKPNPLLLSKIRFKPPIIEMLAKEAGIEPGILDLLRKLGVTSEADLRERLGIKEESGPEAESAMATTQGDEGKRTKGDGEESASTAPATPVNNSVDGARDSSVGPRNAPNGAQDSAKDNPDNTDTTPHSNTGSGRPAGGRTRPLEGAGGRTFISYIATHPTDEDGSDPDGLDQQARMDLEEKAIKLILSRDPRLQRTPTHNKGFDLIEPDGSGQPVRWVEVKAMTAGLADRPVCLSRPQFDCAWIHGEAYWLYIVERAGDGVLARLLRIQDPAGKAKNFVFDQGWRQIADFTDGNPEGGAP